MEPKTKQTLFEILIAAITSAVVVSLFSNYKDKLPEVVKKHFKE